MALTNHAVVRLAAVTVLGESAKGPFQDYLVLGDDIVIANKLVAREYGRLIGGMGVQISALKSVHHTPLRGVEFARKLTTLEGNLSPLPIALLVQNSVLDKIQFLSLVVKRVIGEEIQEVPDLKSLFALLFGVKAADRMGVLWLNLFTFSNFLRLAKSDKTWDNEDEFHQAVLGFAPKNDT